MAGKLIIKGANENNLKHMNVTMPRDSLNVLTGLSGSGKSSLAFDTIYAEGQRRYVESLSSYARQFLGQMDKPDVEMIEGLSPAISIDQKTTSRNPRSTVGTVTEIHDYLRLLYARVGKPHCPVCGRPISSQSVDQMVDIMMNYPEGTRMVIMAPVVRRRKGEHQKILDRIQREGFTRVRVDGEILSLDEDEIKLDKKFPHSIDIVVDRIIVRPGQEGRISEACELAIKEGDGLVSVQIKDRDFEKEQTFSTKLACPEHGASIEELEPRLFSFNAPFGACPVCNGLGFTEKLDQDRVIDQDKTINGGALGKFYMSMDFPGFYKRMVSALAEEHGVSLDTKYKDLPKKFKDELMYGTGNRNISYTYTSNGKKVDRTHPFEGMAANLERRYRESASDAMREWLSGLMVMNECPECHGKRFKPEVLAVTVGGISIAEFSDMPVRDSLKCI